jgi:hypothetical protein
MKTPETREYRVDRNQRIGGRVVNDPHPRALLADAGWRYEAVSGNVNPTEHCLIRIPSDSLWIETRPIHLHLDLLMGKRGPDPLAISWPMLGVKPVVLRYLQLARPKVPVA